MRSPPGLGGPALRAPSRCCRASSGSRPREPVHGLVALLLALGDVERLVSQTGQGGARGVREPAGRLHHLVEGGAGLALHQGDDLRPLRPARLATLGLSRLALLGVLFAAALRLRRRLLLALAADAAAPRGAGLRDLEAEALALLIGPPERLVVLDPDFLQEAERREFRERLVEGCRRHVLRHDREAIVALGRGRKNDKLDVVELRGGRLRHDALRAVHGSTRPHHRDPANRLSAAGFRKALFALCVSPRLTGRARTATLLSRAKAS